MFTGGVRGGDDVSGWTAWRMRFFPSAFARYSAMSAARTRLAREASAPRWSRLATPIEVVWRCADPSGSSRAVELNAAISRSANTPAPC